MSEYTLVAQLKKEEKLNVLTHGLGALLSMVGLFCMLLKVNTDLTKPTISVIVFGCSLVLLYSMSTLYHYACLKGKVSQYKWQRADHIAIFYLIAGTYTPFALISFPSASGWSIFGIAWGIAAFGTIYKLFFFHKLQKISLYLYLGMGWLAIFYIDVLIASVPLSSLILLLLGGLSYSIGTYFYAKDERPYFHPIWHLFVLGGSAFHFAGVVNIL